MRISYTGAMTFLNNKEKYRIMYPHNLEPIGTHVGIQRGSMFHLLCEARHKGWTQGALIDAMVENHVEDQGAIDKGRAMYIAFMEQRYGLVQKEAELHYIVPLNEHHELEGILDAIEENDAGFQLLGERKTMAHVMREQGYWVKDIEKIYDVLKRRWEKDWQITVGLIGAQAMGYELHGNGVVQVVVEPPRDAKFGKYSVLPPIYVHRSPEQIAMVKRWLVMLCDTIELWISTYGIEKPWPPECEKDEWCKRDCLFSELCGRDASEWDTSMFRIRKHRVVSSVEVNQ
jgi:hypothetical protein